MNPFDSARAWLDKQDPAVSGQDGHGQTYHVACVLAQGFGLGESDVFSLLEDYNGRCQPAWSQAELRHKVAEALKAPPGAGNAPGYMLRNGAKAHRYTYTQPRKMPAKSQPKPVDVSASPIPSPMPDGTRALLRAVFGEGEGIRIVNARLNEDQREVPAGEGACLSREEWLRKLEQAKGDPNRIWTSSKKTGIYIGINPMRLGGARDSDVTAFRHALIEFDNISREEQWALYQQSKLPCAAIISSGGKSIHAWVKVDAKNRQEYDERIRTLYEHFESAGYAVDAKNKNPSRFSRLPNCVRFSGRQELLALNTGHPSFSEWLKEQRNADLPARRRISELVRLDTKADPNCLIGFDKNKNTLRYLCKGKSAWLIGPSGIGKSTLLAQFAVGWAQGVPVFGIRPARALRSLIVQAENDEYDLAEMVKGIVAANQLDPDDNIGFPEVDGRIAFVTETTSIGPAFCEKLQRLIDLEKPDIVWVDPLLSFAGINVSDQESCSLFLRQQLQPVLESTGAALIGIHHTGKPKYAKDVANWSAIDYAYSGIGSSELVNWARAVIVLHPHGDGRLYELKMAKRGPRAGATHPDGSRAYLGVWIQQGEQGIRWEQVMPPAEPPPAPEKKAKAKVETAKELPPSERLVQVLTTGPAPTPWDKLKTEIPKDGESANALGRRLANRAKTLKVKDAPTDQTCRKNVVPLLLEGGFLIFDEKAEAYRVAP